MAYFTNTISFSMKKPNFFIIGAPKCGTTSLASWLSRHPQIYVSPHKEPLHFNTGEAWVTTPDRGDYERLFKDADERHIAVGEASTWYLYSNTAVANIEAYAPEAKYIVCLRNPVDMAYSLHEQQMTEGNEHISDFEQAWALNDLRRQGKEVTHWCRNPQFLVYADACALYQQLQRLYEQVPKQRVLVTVLDDMQADPGTVYRQVLDFLGVDDDGRSDFPVMNSAKQTRFPWLLKLLRLVERLKRTLGLHRSFGILGKISKRNLQYRARSPMSVKMRNKLKAYFHDEVIKLGQLIGRDLSAWVDS